jgi:hypothetical protein
MTRLLLVSALSLALAAQGDPRAEQFEKKIRPVLSAKCYACHSSKLKAPMGGLTLDTREGTKRVVDSGKLLEGLRYATPALQMPPTGRLPEATVGEFEAWIKAGAFDPREAGPVLKSSSGVDMVKSKQWWAFQPLKASAQSIDTLVGEALRANGLTASRQADRRTLIRRLALNLTGLAPTFEEVEAFANNSDPAAYEKLVDRLLRDPGYGERWGRYWLDVTRWGEDNPTTEATNPPYPFSWRYRDWVIAALNDDVPYDRFVKMQLAADQLPGAARSDIRALGFLGAGPVYHKDARLSKEVIETLASDDWDERVDVVTRGFLGLTVGCARCHDHKFDPILTKDYYSLASVFASVLQTKRPLADIDPATEKKFAWMQERIFHLNYLANLMKGEPGTKPEEAAVKEKRFRAELETLRAGIPKVEAPLAHAVVDAGVWIDGSDPDLTLQDVRLDTPRDLPVFQRGNVANPGEPAPRGFLTVLGGARFKNGSGRLELAERIFDEAGPLAARVIVNRVWGWHFGKPLVPTPSDFGTQGEPPSHPELLDALAARFVEGGWSLKKLHHEILLSATYRQSSESDKAKESKDPGNKFLWRMSPRRVDFEAWRDNVLRVSGLLVPTIGGPSIELEPADARLPRRGQPPAEEPTVNYRRTVYARVNRSRLSPLLKIYDFADPNQHSPARDVTTTPLQQLFLMNGPFVQEQAAALAKFAVDGDAASSIDVLYRRLFSRPATKKEIDLGLTYLRGASMNNYAQALLETNELMYWP